MSFRTGAFQLETPKDSAQDVLIAQLQSAITGLTAQVNSLSVGSASIVSGFNTGGLVSLGNYSTFSLINSVSITTTAPGYIWAMLSADMYNTSASYGQGFLRIDINGVTGMEFMHQLFPNQTSALAINQRSAMLPAGTYIVNAYAAGQYVPTEIKYSALYAHGNIS